MSNQRTTANAKRHEYYCSREWGLKKEAVHERSGGTCERCNKNEGAAVHHKTYARLYNENLEDLIHLCEECHGFTHGKTHFDPAAPEPSKVYYKNNVKLDAEHYSGELTLLCPHCSFEYLHQNRVVVYEREEDKNTIVTIVENVGSYGRCTNTIPKPKSVDNPSSRRHGVEIQFYCEGCSAISSLRFAQHKGVTKVDWKITTNARKDDDDNEAAAFRLDELLADVDK